MTDSRFLTTWSISGLFVLKCVVNGNVFIVCLSVFLEPGVNNYYPVQIKGTPVRFKRIAHLFEMTSMLITQWLVLIKQVSFNNKKCNNKRSV